MTERRSIRIFQSMSIGVAVMSNRCWHLVNEFTKFIVQTKTDVTADTIAR